MLSTGLKSIIFITLFGLFLALFPEPLLVSLFGDMSFLYSFLDIIGENIGIIYGGISLITDLDLFKAIIYGFSYVFVFNVFARLYLFLFRRITG